METRMDNELDIELSLLFEERTEDPCEHTQHGEQTVWHAGPGEWLLAWIHRGCGMTVEQHVLVCDKFYGMLFADRFIVRCPNCGEQHLDVGETYTIVGRKGVDF